MPPSIQNIALHQLQLWMNSSASVVRLVMVLCWLYISSWYWAQPYHTSKLTGQQWVEELICGHPERIYNELATLTQNMCLLRSNLLSSSIYVAPDLVVVMSASASNIPMKLLQSSGNLTDNGISVSIPSSTGKQVLQWKSGKRALTMY
ncbi:hypothetical protein B0H16DRAFT_1476561 [Mycena metata]|uniref:Uncharacterized protein n=1 Tax=Mycena metata TaxID=1033252 RepID=A0AAD7HBJ4_9AGAR|nr:hypothetical protein B0H16DRAFT_1476561 [Mycena metata]